MLHYVFIILLVPAFKTHVQKWCHSLLTKGISITSTKLCFVTLKKKKKVNENSDVYLLNVQ